MTGKKEIKGLRALKKADFEKKFLPGCVYHPVVEAVKLAPQFMFSLRKDRVIIYYKCDKVLTITDKDKIEVTLSRVKKESVLGDLLKNARKHSKETVSLDELDKNFNPKDKSEWLKLLLSLGAYMDEYNNRKDGVEKEIQQRIVLENNLLGKSELTDYYIFDTEYIAQQSRSDIINNGRFDAVAVHYSENCMTPQLAFIEVKAGNDAVSDKYDDKKAKHSGVYDHWFDAIKFNFDAFKSDNKNDDDFFDDKLIMLSQLNKFGVLKLSGDLKECIKKKQIDKEHFQMIFILANYDQSGQELLTEIEDIEKAMKGDFRKNNLPADEMERIKKNVKKIDLRFATSSFMGYGLFDECMLTLEQFKELLKIKK